MNRRRAPSAVRKKPARKKPIQRKPPEKKKAAKRPVRKNVTAKKAASKKSTRKAAPKKAARKKVVRKAAHADRAQNRRRPVPRKPRRTEPKKSWRERAVGVRENLGGWMIQRRGLLRRAVQVVLVGLALAALVWLGDQSVQYAHSASAFAIGEIIVEGNHQLEDIDVRRAARLQIGSNIFETSNEDARNHLLQHPWIEEANVVRKLPGRIRIEITERQPVALVALDQLYLVSHEGAVFKRLGVDDPVDLPVITGIASERFYDDLDYRTAILLRSMAVLQDYEGAGLAKREPVSEIHFEGVHGIELFVGKDGMNVRLGNGQHRQKLRRLRQVLERLAREKTRPSYVYLDNVRSPERVTVRLP
ncbi:MAG: FtsQ-type POTRA domain-containing protein [Deltaproteobacteria bacterium]|jgi:cell division protein FtsQ|nr:FtsQ-type POTRA domain-containing protein [Deltaproteobacteria bacterium]